MFRNKSVNVHQFAMVPRSEIPRSSFRMQKGYKTTFDGGWLIPVFCEEILPGDTFNLHMTAFARLATPLFPIMDNMYLESFFFFVPNRLVWENWVRFMGEQDEPDSSIDFEVPQVVSPVNGWPVGSLADFFELPTVGQVTGGLTVSHSCLPLRAHNLIWNEWFRDENLYSSLPISMGDGPDLSSDFYLQRRGKRHDYFTSCLPWPQKGNVPVTVPLGGTAPVSIAADLTNPGISNAPTFEDVAATDLQNLVIGPTPATVVNTGAPTGGAGSPLYWQDPGLVGIADLSAATAVTINQLRESFQIQKLLERDARGGTRYTEIVRSHFGVLSPDSRLQRPEYLGGGSTPINISPVAQTSGTPEAAGTPQGNLSAFGTAVARHGFTQSFTEHGFVIGFVNVRADLTYQQGLRRHWSRLTRYEYYFPVFAALGEQAVLQKEIYITGGAGDNLVFGYQERWAEYRYMPSAITGYFRSTYAQTIDPWHLAQHFTVAPVLDRDFMDDSPPIERIVAVGAGAGGQQFLFDAFFDIKAARPLPLYSVPGLIDHF